MFYLFNIIFITFFKVKFSSYNNTPILNSFIDKTKDNTILTTIINVDIIISVKGSWVTLSLKTTVYGNVKGIYDKILAM